MRNAISYIRVSTTRQGDSGLGLDGQQEQINRFAELERFHISRRFSDCHTGAGADSINDRPGLPKAIRLSKETGWPIIVAGYDRVSRHSAALERLIREERVEIISASDGRNVDPVVIASRSIRAEREAEEISKRTKAALDMRRAQGLPLGNTKNLDEAQRKGADANRRKALARDEELAVVIDEIRAAGCTTAREIAAALNDRGIRTARGEFWNAGTIRRPLKRIAGLAKQREHERNLSNPM